ncbi:hypothetical protein IZU99_08055 [Oscillospiraceae bacterium CM]|nr:hypothetical protein IZU99_08055 [Oscillospiraceae bacterium CM]
MAPKKLIIGSMIAAVIIIIAIAVVGIILTFRNGRPGVSDAQDRSGGLVSDQYTYEDLYTDGVNNSYKISYHVPKINLDTADAKNTNSEIYTNCMEEINKELITMKDGCSPVLLDVSYSTYVQGDVVSIIIKQCLD